MTTKPQKIEGEWSPLDIGGKDIKKDFIARCHVEVGAGGFLRFPLPGSKGRNWLDERLMADFISDLLASERQRCVDSLNQAKDGDYYTLSASKYRILKNNL